MQLLQRVKLKEDFRRKRFGRVSRDRDEVKGRGGFHFVKVGFLKQ